VKIVYFGTPNFAAVVLKYLIDHTVDIAAVVTQPDRPKGRSLQLAESPVKIVSKESIPQIQVLQPQKCSEEDFLKQLAALEADLFVVVAFGQILPQKLLDIPPLGCINVHASLLPKYRGAAPIQRCLMDGERETGIAIQKMVRQLDAGDVIAVSKTAISPDMTFAELEQALMELAKPLLLKVIHEHEQRIPVGKVQDHEMATYASKITIEEGEIKWARSAEDIHNLIRAYSPKPGAWTWIKVGDERKRLKILRSSIVEKKGKIGEIAPNCVIGCSRNSIQLIEVQPEGKKPMRASDWIRGQKNISFYS